MIKYKWEDIMEEYNFKEVVNSLFSEEPNLEFPRARRRSATPWRCGRVFL